MDKKANMEFQSRSNCRNFFKADWIDQTKQKFTNVGVPHNLRHADKNLQWYSRICRKVIHHIYTKEMPSAQVTHQIQEIQNIQSTHINNQNGLNTWRKTTNLTLEITCCITVTTNLSTNSTHNSRLSRIHKIEHKTNSSGKCQGKHILYKQVHVRLNLMMQKFILQVKPSQTLWQMDPI